MSRDPALGPKPSVGSLFSDSLSLVSDDPRIVLVTLVGGALSVIPIVGSFLNILVVGFAHVLAQQSLGWSVDARTSLPMRFLYLLGGSIVGGLAILIGLVFLVLPGIYLFVRFSLLVPAVMIDGEGPLEGLSESWERAGGNMLTIFGFQIAVTVLSLFLAVPVVLAFGVDAVFVPPVDPTAQLAFGLVTGAVGAVGVGGLVLMYRAFGSSAGPEQPGDRQDEWSDAQW